MHSALRRTAAVLAVSSAGAGLSVGLGAGQAAAAGHVYSVSYNGQISVTSAKPNTSFGPYLTMAVDRPFDVAITVDSDAGGVAYINPEVGIVSKPLPAGVTFTVAGAGCGLSRDISGYAVPLYSCTVVPGVQTFTATVTISSSSPLYTAGNRTVMLQSSLRVASEPTYLDGGWADVGIPYTPTTSSTTPTTPTTPKATPSAPTTTPPTPSRPITATRPAAPATSSRPTTADASPRPGTPAQVAPPAPSGQPTSSASGTPSTSPASTTSPTSSSSSSDDTSSDDTSSTPTTAATSPQAVPVAAAARSSHGQGSDSGLLIGAGVAAAVAVASGGAFVVLRRRRATSR